MEELKMKAIANHELNFKKSDEDNDKLIQNKSTGKNKDRKPRDNH